MNARHVFLLSCQFGHYFLTTLVATCVHLDIPGFLGGADAVIWETSYTTCCNLYKDDSYTSQLIGLHCEAAELNKIILFSSAIIFETQKQFYLQ